MLPNANYKVKLQADASVVPTDQQKQCLAKWKDYCRHYLVAKAMPGVWLLQELQAEIDRVERQASKPRIPKGKTDCVPCKQKRQGRVYRKL